MVEAGTPATQLAGSAGRRRGAVDVVTRSAVGVGKRAHHRRLAGAGQRLDRVDAVAAGRDRADGCGLVGVQRRLSLAERHVDEPAGNDPGDRVVATNRAVKDRPLAGQQILRRESLLA